jgi:hypothetical protein
MAFRLSKRVAADLFEEEYIIANLETGLYYSLQGSGIFLLKNLPFASSSAVIEKFGKTFPDQQQEVIDNLNHIWQELEKEAIVELFDADLPESELEFGNEFVASTLHSYADMQDLLALDPIHEVDGSGWKKENDK